MRDGLAKGPDDRIGSAAEYIERIEALLGPEPAAAAAPPGSTAAVASPARRLARRAWLAPAALAVVAGIADETPPSA